MVARSVSGLPRQFWLMKANKRCSILFHLLVPGGRWQTLVTPVIDASLMSAEQLNFHPLANTESTGISPQDLLSFIASCGREAVISELADSDTGNPTGNGADPS